MSDCLPHEVLLEIFLRLPVKSLLQCTTICKSWNSIITNPSFITTHLSRTTVSNNTTADLLLLRQNSKNPKKERYSLHRDNETFDEYAEIEFPFQSRNIYFRIVGYCNGLLCLSDDFITYTYTIILYNPSIRKSVTLPRPRVTFDSHGPYMFVLGFGFDGKSNDYKVVRMVYVFGENDYVAPPEVELYSLSTGLWRGISAPAPPYYVIERSWSQAFMNGAVHWPAFDSCKKDKFNLILSFDLGNEVFSKMELPGSLVRVCAQDMSIAVFGDSLSVFQFNWFLECCSIWVMKEYGVAESWSKQFTINLQGGIGRTLALRKNGEILVSTADGKLVSYHPETQRIKDLAIRDAQASFYVDTYIESLVLLNEVNEVSRRKAKSCDVVTHKGAPVLLRDEEN